MNGPSVSRRGAPLAARAMRCVPTALLLHTTAAGRHHDWLLGDPAREPTADARLWTARVEPASWAWGQAREFALTPLPPHRSRYLRYEGPISGNRGSVRRVDAGYALVLRWQVDPAGSGGKGVLAVRMRHFAGWVELIQLDAGQWLARILTLDSALDSGLESATGP